MTSNNDYSSDSASSDPWQEMWEEKTHTEEELERAYNSDDDLWE